MISWIFFLNARSLELSARLQNTRQCICSNWKMLENQWANLQANSYLKKSQRILSKHFSCAEEGFKVWPALSLFAVNCKWSLQTPFCEFWHVNVPFNMVAQKGHTCKLKMLLQTKNFTCKLKMLQQTKNFTCKLKMLLQTKNYTCKLKIVHAN